MNFKKLLATAALAAAALAAGQAASAKALVLYYSQLGPQMPADAHPTSDMGNTQYVAYAIKDAVGGDIFRVENAVPYADNGYRALTEVAKKERQANARPAMKGSLPDLSQYDTVYIGAPVWWSDYPMVFYTMLDRYDFAGKTLVAFNTNGGSGPGVMVSTLKRAEPNAKVLDDCLDISSSQSKQSDEAVKTWLNAHSLLNK
ncbi:MAG: flavodoxin [Succinivibrio sp.]